MKRQLFISKNFNEIQGLIDFCNEKDIEVIAYSFLQFEAIPFQIEESYEAIFFGSPRGVDFFLSQEIIPLNTIIGCIGEITAQTLRNYQIEPDFIGKTSGDASLIAEEFKKFIRDEKILFPQSSISNRSISSVFNPDQIFEISIYKTVVHSLKIPDCDFYIFTSPSNIDGFLLENKIPTNGKIIAWGKTTEKHLIEKNIKVNQVLNTASIEELIEVLAGL